MTIFCKIIMTSFGTPSEHDAAPVAVEDDPSEPQLPLASLCDFFASFAGLPADIRPDADPAPTAMVVADDPGSADNDGLEFVPSAARSSAVARLRLRSFVGDLAAVFEAGGATVFGNILACEPLARWLLLEMSMLSSVMLEVSLSLL